MELKGVSYDVGRVMGGNWRPQFDPKIVRRELEIIQKDLHCNAVRICGLDIGRLTTAAEVALQLGLNVWLSPEMWDKSQAETLQYIVKAAAAAEKLHEKWPDRLVFLVGSELTLFMQGIVPGKNITQRMSHPSFWKNAQAGTHNPPLNDFLARANAAVRQVYPGKVSYASLIWEAVNWSLFDFVGVDHYRSARIQSQYADMLKPLFAFGKPVVITEFGCRTYQGADTTPEGMAGDIIDHAPSPRVVVTYLANALRTALFGTQLPPPKGRLKKGNYVRDEGLQARELSDMLGILDRAGVEGTFIMTFVSPISPYSANPRDDLDMANYSLVKSYGHGEHGATYPDMAWEPKEAFRAVADYYAK